MKVKKKFIKWFIHYLVAKNILPFNVLPPPHLKSRFTFILALENFAV